MSVSIYINKLMAYFLNFHDIDFRGDVRCHRSLFHNDSTLLRSLWRDSGLIVTWFIEHNPIFVDQIQCIAY